MTRPIFPMNRWLTPLALGLSLTNIAAINAPQTGQATVLAPAALTESEIQLELQDAAKLQSMTPADTTTAPIEIPASNTSDVTPPVSTGTETVQPPTTTNPPSEIPPAPVAPVFAWSTDLVNNSEWSAETESDKWATPEVTRVQILLKQNHASPGAIDGVSGRNMLKAISAFEFMNQLPVDGKMDADVWNLLKQNSTAPALTTYTLTAEDVNHKYPTTIPVDYALQAKMDSLDYTSVVEMLGEKFKISQRFLKTLNPAATFNTVGETILVPDFGAEDMRPIKLLVAIKKASQIYAFDANTKMIATFPATVGSNDMPSPTGKFHIVGVTQKPWYSYDPKNFIQGNNLQPLRLPPGPNNPVGLVWMGLSKPSFGIHGNPNPELISKNNSHGCVRVANWDALNISQRVTTGTVVHLQ